MPYHHQVETMAPEAREAQQLVSLQSTVRQAYENVPFYRSQLDQAGVKPEEIQSLKDLQKLPFTKKHHLREHYPFGLLAVPLSDVKRLHGSSGTSGKPTIVAYTEEDLEQWADIVARAIYMAGGRPGDLLHNAYGYGLFTGGLGLHDGSEKLGCTTVPISGGNTQRQITLIQDFQPTIICGTPSYVMNIGETMQKMGIDPRETSIEYAILGSEPWTEEMRQSLEKMFDMKAMDIYGLSEVIGPGVAMECVDGQNGLHIAEDQFYPEIIDPETLQPLPDGEEGELVFTSLQKQALPVLRYRTGDLCSLTRETCSCGRTTVRMSRIKGRIDDMIIVRGVNVFPSEFERYILQNEELECHYQINLRKKGSMDTVSLDVEVNHQFFDCLDNPSFTCSEARRLKRRIESQLKNEALVSVDVTLKAPGTMPRFEGKAKRVKDLRQDPEAVTP